MEIRAARPTDAAAACGVLRRSITVLCVGDHGNDPAALAAWLANKTPEAVARWIAAPAGCVLVAEEEGAVIGVGSATAEGRIGLNYVAPEARFQGVSKAMLRALEDRVRAFGATEARLESTTTALRFYRAAGYREDGAPLPLLGALAYPMVKPLGRNQ